MKIVIDIPESDYELIKNDGVQSHIACADEAIRNAIVLPKEHGDLIDRNHLEEMKEPFYSSNGDMVGYGVLMDDIRKYVEPIIPADKGE